ncbi:MAG TPA: aspartate kinase [Thermoplasmata archaeon]|nr:aspartate kinase [Thermoplasmata archaeon]
MRHPRPIVLKFGGAALGRPASVVERIRNSRKSGRPVVVVVSARRGVTDRLEAILAHPARVSGHHRAVEWIRRAHPGLPGEGGRLLRRLEDLVAGVERSGSVDGPAADQLRSCGERLAAHWLTELLRGEQLPAVAVESDRAGLVTDNAYGHSLVLLTESTRRLRPYLERLLARGRLPIVTGYFGRSLEGRVATLGRGGSDYSASAIGAILGAERVELVKLASSVRTADPRLVGAARPIRRLSFEEAEELAQFGARVLHPLTIEPARRAGFELWIRSVDEPELVTVIGPAGGRHGARAVTLLAPLRLLRVRVPGGRQRPGVVAEVSTALAKAGINLVTLFTSSALLSLVVRPDDTTAARAALAPVTDGAAVVEGPHPVGLVTGIGEGILQDLGRMPRRVLGASQGFSATPRSISLAVPLGASRAALEAVHRAIVLEAGR